MLFCILACQEIFKNSKNPESYFTEEKDVVVQGDCPGIRERVRQSRGLLPASRQSQGESLRGGDVLPLPDEPPGHQEDELVVVVVVAGTAGARPAPPQVREGPGLSLAGVADHCGGVGAVTDDVDTRPVLLLDTAGETEHIPGEQEEDQLNKY